MKKIKFLLLLLFLLFSLKVNAWYYYPYICDDYYCASTYEWELSKNSNKYFLIPNLDEKITNKSLNTIVNEKLDILLKYYWDTNFTIYNIYDSSEDKLIDVDFDLKKLIEYSDKITIWKKTWLWRIEIDKEYDNWLDYLFWNFEYIINDLHSYNFPYWEKQNSLKYFLENIEKYSVSENRFYVRNVCETIDCYKTNYFKIWYDNQTEYSYIDGEINSAKNFTLNTFVVSKDYKISNLFMKAWWTVEASFWFEDYLDVSKDFTNYKYIISYSYEWGEIIDELTETVKISKDFKLYSDTINPELLDQMFELNILNSRSKHISLNIKEKFIRTKTGKITFYLSVENLNTWDKFERQPINEIQKLNVLPVDKIWSYESNIFGFTKVNNDKGYNVWDTFWISISLKDIYWNTHYDQIEWYQITFSEWTSDAFEMSNQWSDKFFKSIYVKSENNEKMTIDFKIRLTKAWYHAFKWFNIKFKNKRNNYSYSNPILYGKYEKIVPKELILNWTNLSFHIKQAEQSDFPISCTNDKIIIETNCTSDNFSWCDASKNQKLIFSSESDNGKTWVIKIQDYAFNVKNFNYTINHIDKTAPTIELSNWSEKLSTSYPIYENVRVWSRFWRSTYQNVFKWYEDYFLANDEGLKINLYEWTTSNCTAKQSVLVKLDWVEIFNREINESSKEIILEDVFKKTWKKNLEVIVKDNYNNTSTKKYVLNIVPDYPDITKSELTLLTTWEKYADASEFYTYKIKLKDKFWNIIYNKKINKITQDCEWYSWCKDLKIDMVNNSWDNWVLIYWYDKSNSNWEILFNVKWLVPGEFTNRFKLNFNSWDKKYVSLSELKNVYILNNSLNKFKNIFYWELSVSRDWEVWWNKVEIWTKLNYKLEIKKYKDTFNFSTTIDDFSTKIKQSDEENTYIDSVWELSWLETKDIRFSLSINNRTTVLWTPWIIINWPEISYNIWWKNVKYKLSNASNSSEIILKNTLNKIEDRFIWVKIIWNLQSSWNQEITWQNKNFSDISKSDLRTQIRKKAYEYVKSMKNQDIVWKVKYVEGEDIEISWNISNYETLVVKNWNVIITGNLNTNKSNFWIIVLKDWFDVNKDYETSWNIYIDKDVTKINALIYADWWVFSSNWNDIYNEDTIQRNNDLQKQLFINWTLFTRNTIAWSINIDWKYYLPWGWKTTDFNLSMIYDLNYLRRWNKDCDKNWSWNCIYSDATIIKYDQNNNPKLFWN